MTPRTFKILDLIGLAVLFVVAYVFFAGPDQDEICFDELEECYKKETVIYIGPRLSVEVQEPLPHKPVQEYEVGDEE